MRGLVERLDCKMLGRKDSVVSEDLVVKGRERLSC